MIQRHLESELKALLGQSPVVAIIGARQVGKTTLAKAILALIGGESLYLDLERPADQAALQDPERFLDRHADTLVVIDEVQLRSDLFPILRSLVDRDRKPGRFLLLGSSNPNLMRQSGESLAGRIAYLELSPFLSCEISDSGDRSDALWVRGGFPESFLASTEEQSFRWREDFIQTYLRRDLSVMGYDIRVPALTMDRLWRMLAHLHGQLLNVEKLSAGLGLSQRSIRRYLDILGETFMLRRLEPYHINIKKRLIKTPKTYIRDSGLLHSLLGIASMDALLAHPVVGSSWEGFCIDQITARMPRAWRPFFYRTRAGAEIDLVLETGGSDPPILVECKHSMAPKLARGFWQAREDLKADQAFVVYPGDRDFPLAEGVEAIGLADIGRIWNSERQT